MMPRPASWSIKRLTRLLRRLRHSFKIHEEPRPWVRMGERVRLAGSASRPLARGWTRLFAKRSRRRGSLATSLFLPLQLVLFLPSFLRCSGDICHELVTWVALSARVLMRKYVRSYASARAGASIPYAPKIRMSRTITYILMTSLVSFCGYFCLRANGCEMVLCNPDMLCQLAPAKACVTRSMLRDGSGRASPTQRQRAVRALARASMAMKQTPLKQQVHWHAKARCHAKMDTRNRRFVPSRGFARALTLESLSTIWLRVAREKKSSAMNLSAEARRTPCISWSS
mmetsp:Transcript_3830/g.9518  ORF Transcript_3830/g.9518 Transcript_3830/m.9518 type:complete len:285 (+) Transcript_3830:869-1723(+)